MLQKEDMLELTRRMTIARNSFTRIAGSYRDEEGYDEISETTYRILEKEYPSSPLKK